MEIAFDDEKIEDEEDKAVPGMTAAVVVVGRVYFDVRRYVKSVLAIRFLLSGTYDGEVVN